MHDELLNFGQCDFSVVNLGAASTVIPSFPDLIPMGATMDMFKGEPFLVEVSVDTMSDVDYSVFHAFVAVQASSTSPVATEVIAGRGKVIAKSAEYAIPGSTSIINTGLYHAHELAVGEKFYIAVAPMLRTVNQPEIYLGAGLQTVLASNPATVGTFTARLIPYNAVQVDMIHGSGYTLGV